MTVSAYIFGPQTAWAVMICLTGALLPDGASAQASIFFETSSATAAPRRFGAESLDRGKLLEFHTLADTDKSLLALSFPDSQGLSLASERYRPRVVVSGYPLIRAKGIVKGRGVLFIADSGKSGTYNEPARIWRLDPTSRRLDLFYQGPMLLNSKWMYYRMGAAPGDDQLIVSDYGAEPTPREPGTGEGAKVFYIPVRPDHTAGGPQLIHGGPPLRSPEGVTVIGKTVILADWAAGPPATRPEAPNNPFLSGVVFAIPLEGGAPRRLFPEHTFITLIGACIYFENDQMYLRLIDIDGGRKDTSVTAELPQSGLVAFFRSKVESAEPLRLGPLEEVPLTEDVPITLGLQDVLRDDTIVIKGLEGTRFQDDTSTAAIPGTPQNRTQTVLARSPLRNSDLKFEVKIVGVDGAIKNTTFGTIPKRIVGSPILANNKHGGAMIASVGFGPIVTATADGTSQSLSLIPTQGGSGGVVWQGEPFVSPMGTQFSWDGTKLWVTDQFAGPNGTAAIFEVDVPSLYERHRMFPNTVRTAQ